MQGGATMQTGAATAQTQEETKTCVRCNARISPTQDHEVTPEGVLCRSCFEARRTERERVPQEPVQELSYPLALIGALVGGAAGAAAWWAVTVISHTAFGAVAILIGIAVGKGATLMSGGRRTRGLQILSMMVAGVSFFYASYLVNRTFIRQALAQEGKEAALSLLPDPGLLVRVVSLNFDVLSFLFLGIVLWEAWKLSGPAKLAK
jgi:hypothetical protein